MNENNTTQSEDLTGKEDTTQKRRENIVKTYLGRARNLTTKDLSEALSASLLSFEENSKSATLVGNLYHGLVFNNLDTQAKQVKTIASAGFAINIKLDKDTGKTHADYTKKKYHLIDDDLRQSILRDLVDENLGVVTVFKELTKKDAKQAPSTNEKMKKYSSAIVKQVSSFKDLQANMSAEEAKTACYELRKALTAIEEAISGFEGIKQKIATKLAA